MKEYIAALGVIACCVMCDNAAAPVADREQPAALSGVWETASENSEPLDGDWIPDRYHIERESGNGDAAVYRIRIMDPLACTDSYDTLRNGALSFSQYSFHFQIRFTSDSVGQATVSRGDSVRIDQLYRSAEEPYFGGCL
jgi:hypothetical protein